MTQEPEQIGVLTFVANADYPYPFAVAKPPRFWMEETSGALSAAIEVYMRSEDLNPQQMELIGIYLRQYIERAVITDEQDRRRLLGRIEKLRGVRDLERFAEDLSEVGVEPF
ncbi:hypothetical protein [Candidatus Oscillochloris fontis]|uniref:hypothetical protein n=1 Tax=Candidatus Oscillochloris fontis TaxID=2496868 RepID=UPI00101DA7D4|nr:hypothetical protein [Candidatus Oscillochloris fontis]